MTADAKICHHCDIPIAPENRIYDNPSDPTRYRGVCRLCKNVLQIKQRENRKQRDAEASVSGERAQDTVPARQHIGVGTYTTADERTFYRNDGLKHIQSRGNPT
jgi:hypothetical protein